MKIKSPLVPSIAVFSLLAMPVLAQTMGTPAPTPASNQPRPAAQVSHTTGNAPAAPHATAAPPAAPPPSPCKGPTFTTEEANGVSIIRGHTCE